MANKTHLEALITLREETRGEIDRMKLELEALELAIEAMRATAQATTRKPAPVTTTKPAGNGYLSRQDMLLEIVKRTGRKGIASGEAVAALMASVDTTTASARQMLYLLANKGLVERTGNATWRVVR